MNKDDIIKNKQNLLFCLAFLSFGAGDGISAAYMISIIGVNIESSPAVRFISINFGPWSIVPFKLMALLAIFIAMSKYEKQVQKEEKIETQNVINSILIATIIGGLMATYANMFTAANGIAPYSPTLTKGVFLFVVLLLIIVSDFYNSSSTEELKKGYC